MATVSQVLYWADRCGFVRSSCVHPEWRVRLHVVRDYPRALRSGHRGPFYRLHLDLRRSDRTVCYIAGTGVGGRNSQRRVSLREAIEWMKDVSKS